MKKRLLLILLGLAVIVIRFLPVIRDDGSVIRTCMTLYH